MYIILLIKVMVAVCISDTVTGKRAYLILTVC